MKTERQRRGAAAEEHASTHLAAAGWEMLAKNVRVGRDEIDLLAIDPGPPAELVFVEVRGLRVASFGAPEEGVDRRKVAHLYRSMSALLAIGSLPNGVPLPRLPGRVDLVVVDARATQVELRHLRRLLPP
jgi:putative endonuclease